MLVLALGLVACGGATETELLNPPLDQQGTDASGQKDQSVPPNEAGVKDGSSADAFVIPEAGPDTSPPPLKIQCGNAQCKVGVDVCCRSGFGNFTYKCVPNAGQCQGSNSIVLECSNAESCPDTMDVCCAPLAQQGQAFVATGTLCAAPSQCTGQDHVIVCDPQAINNCPNGGNCSMSTITLPGYDICK